MSRALASFFGDRAEQWAEEQRGVACVNGVVDGSLDESNEQIDVEVKGCVIGYSSGRIGRLRFWQRQHKVLRDRDGVYLVIVYDPNARDPVQYDRFVHWSSVEEIMQEYGYSWYEARKHGMRSKQTQIPWSRFFPELTE